MEPRLCQLDAALGRSTGCPGESCPFWRDERCVIEPLQADFTHDACLVTTLVGVRAGLARGIPGDPLREFHPPGLA